MASLNGFVRRHRALVVGLVALGVVTPVYLAIAERAGRPLAMFAIPPLLTAVVGGWRATSAVAAASVVVASAIGIAGPLDAPALAARLSIIAVAALSAVAGALFRERQSAELLRLTEAAALYHVFEAGLVPTPAPPPGYRVEVRFVSSQHTMTLGGDFVDAIALDDGRLAVVVGDVCGHGARQAAFATAMRAGWRTVARTHRPEPSGWLHHLERTLFRDVGDVGFVTVCTMIVDRRRSQALVSSAGHPAPILLDDPARPAIVRPGRPLGLGLAASWSTSTVPVRRGLLLYTDGLLENRATGAAGGRWDERSLVDWLHARTDLDLPSLADELLDEAVERRRLDDDVAVLLVGA